MEKLSYKIEGFEGPLDLMLMLISKNKLNIYDIPIAELLDQYMDQIRIMKQEDMDVASEFLEMAARLVHIKSVSLLPKKESEEDQLRQELTGQLIEYKLCKEIAAKLSDKISFDSIVRDTENVPADLIYRRNHKPDELVRAYINAVGRGKKFLPPPKEHFDDIVTRRFVSVRSQIVSVLKKLRKVKIISFKQLFAGKKQRSERVAAFLAVLELVKGKRIRLEGDEDNSMVKLVDGGAEN